MNEDTLEKHYKTKKHKRRLKLFYDKKTGQLKKEEDIFHSQKVADAAKGRGGTDNGTRAAAGMAVEPAAAAPVMAAAAPVDFGEL